MVQDRVSFFKDLLEHLLFFYLGLNQAGSGKGSDRWSDEHSDTVQGQDN